MEIYVRETGGQEEPLLCEGCGSGDLEPQPEKAATGAPTWSLMSRLSARCNACGRENDYSWPGRVRFRFVSKAERV